MVEVRGVEPSDAPSQNASAEESGTTGVDCVGQEKPRICWELLGVQRSQEGAISQVEPA